MAHNNGIVSAPVSFADVNTVLGTSHTDLAALCKDGNIKKWAMYKPESFAVLGILSLANRQTNKFGLTPLTNLKAQSVAQGYTGTNPAAANVGDSGYSITDVSNANQEWTYTKPSGGLSSPYRLTDFNGYLHSARELIYGWKDITFTLQQLSAVIAYDYANTQDISDGAAAWKLTCATCNPFQVSCNVDGSSGTYIGGGGGDQIPLSTFFGVASENWRMGLGVFVDGETKMHFFVSNWPLKSVTGALNAYRALPSLETNQFLCQKFISATGSTSKTFKAIPLMIKDCIMSSGTLNNKNLTLPVLQNGIVYSAPSSNTIINITVQASTIPYVAGINTWPGTATSDGVFIVGRYNTGATAGTSPNIANVQQFAIFRCTGASFSGTKTLRYSFTYSYGVGSNRATVTLSGTASITTSDTITINDQTYVAVNIGTAQPNLDISAADAMTYV